MLQWVDQAIAAAQRVRTAKDAADAAAPAAELAALTERISEGLQQAQTHMAVLLKAEGLAGDSTLTAPESEAVVTTP